jgi:Predicted nucleoside-diphosphate sugar epimerases
MRNGTAVAGLSHDSLVEKGTDLPRSVKKTIMVAADLIALPVALWVAITLRLGSFDHGQMTAGWLYLALPLVTLPVLSMLGLYRTIVRFISSRDLFAPLLGVTASTLLLILITFAPESGIVPRSSLVIYWALALLWVGGSRLLVRSLLAPRSAQANRVVIYGAGGAGARLASAMEFSAEARPVAFIDDDRSLWGAVINGLRVYKPMDLGRLKDQFGVDKVLLAMPSISRATRRTVLKSVQLPGLRVQTVPDITEILSGGAQLEDVRDVDANDLLGREPVAPIQSLFDACIRGKVVMVTGAGGSIGSELCRQILRHGARRLVLFEMSELALYNIERELRVLVAAENIRTDISPLLGNARNRARLREVIHAFGVNTIYHAAAYKHVPIVECNVIEGIQNNVISTWYTAEAAVECGVETFVLISTDKAVNPTNVMGATKRLAELILQAFSERGGRTKFCMVRFGNVLESSGSVVPLFREQIRRGGPVTVTHPEVIRYFMTITEAAQLVLQAAGMAIGGEVYVLDMGKPVRIADLARRMIALSGLTVRDEENASGDIEIRFTGLRPAEKLYEELLIGTNVTGTMHPMILRAVEHSVPWEELRAILDELKELVGKVDICATRTLLHRAVREYQPAADITDHVWCSVESQRKVQSKVTSFEGRRRAAP